MDNNKRIYRIYKSAGLQIQNRRKKRKKSHLRLVLPEPLRPNQIWSMDFVSDTLSDSRRFRCFNIVDDFTRESLSTFADRSLPAEKVIHVLNALKAERGLPEMIVCDNGHLHVDFLFGKLNST